MPLWNPYEFFNNKYFRSIKYMDITKVNGIINHNGGFTGRKLNIIDISRFNYKVTRCNKVYDDKFISKFDINIQTHLKTV